MKDNLASKLKRQVYGRKLAGYVILIAISLVFVFFGFTGKYSSMGGGAAAQVNDAIISVADYEHEEEQIRQYYQNMFGGAIDLSSQRQLLRQQALENLVRGELVSQAAQKEGIIATDAEVRDYIVKDIPIFQDKGQFQRDRYLNYLEYSHSSPADFENKIRKEISSMRTRHLFEAASQPTTLEISKLKDLQQQKLNIGFVRLDVDGLAGKLPVSDAEAEAQLKNADFEKKAQENFRVTKSDYEQKESAHVQHILIAFKAGDADSEKKALTKIEDIQKKAAKEDFGSLAAKYSEDPGSKSKKGDLGTNVRGKMVKEFDDVSFTAPIGKVTGPVKSPYGYHLIKVLSRTSATEATWDNSKLKVAKKLLAKDKVESQLKAIDDAVAKGDQAAVDADLKNIGATWDETGYFDLGGDAIPKLTGPTLTEAAFEVSAKHPLLTRVIHEADARYVLKFNGAKNDSDVKVADNSEQALLRRRADGSFSSWLNHYRATATVETNPKALQ